MIFTYLLLHTVHYYMIHTCHCYLKRILEDKIMLEKILSKSYKCSCLLNFQVLYQISVMILEIYFMGDLKKNWLSPMFLNISKVRIQELQNLLILQIGRPRQQCGKVPDSRLEIYQPYHTVSPKSQILIHTHRVTVTLMVMGIVTLMPLEIGSIVIVLTLMILILNLCKNHNSLLSFLLAAIAGLFSVPALC